MTSDIEVDYYKEKCRDPARLLDDERVDMKMVPLSLKYLAKVFKDSFWERSTAGSAREIGRALLAPFIAGQIARGLRPAAVAQSVIDIVSGRSENPSPSCQEQRDYKLRQPLEPGPGLPIQIRGPEALIMYLAHVAKADPEMYVEEGTQSGLGKAYARISPSLVVEARVAIDEDGQKVREYPLHRA